MEGAFGACANPTQCMACQSCSFDALLFSSLDQQQQQQQQQGFTYDPSQFVDEWLRQSEVMNMETPFPSEPTPGQDVPSTNLSFLPQFTNMEIAAAGAPTYGTFTPSFSPPSESRCRCPPGQCSCSDGSQECLFDDTPVFYDALVFASSGSGQQNACYSRDYPSQSGPIAGSSRSSGLHSPFSEMPASSFGADVGSGNATNPRRSPSFGSHSSGRSSPTGGGSSSEVGQARPARHAGTALLRPIFPKGGLPSS